MYIGSTVGASGAIFGLLLAYGVTFPDRPIYLYFLFQIPAKYFVMIVGAVALYSSLTAEGGSVAHFAHLVPADHDFRGMTGPASETWSRPVPGDIYCWFRK
jgi:membrane associated rhomboid family serine protease